MTFAKGGGRDEAKLWLKQWCCHANKYDRKYLHLKWKDKPKSLAEIDEVEVEAQQYEFPDPPPWETVVPDDVLDMESEVPQLSPQWQPHPIPLPGVAS